MVVVVDVVVDVAVAALAGGGVVVFPVPGPLLLINNVPVVFRLDWLCDDCTHTLTFWATMLL